ncbi:ArdC-like ssDNA-binding domain-containing protein [Rubinisphaera italica]|uniref:Uncharacterized protein n=1 Tax=Rubinisphaera italica TaxID=2527969 RepID=A0A5C5XEX4_9PLAN|nr:ArdC-like ssDNA-binding domain-containing protein [Rubinisphaera italica]TWT60981.1 hypothetical protein Pan54_17130 [Rubinisphaera italica]
MVYRRRPRWSDHCFASFRLLKLNKKASEKAAELNEQIEQSLEALCGELDAGKSEQLVAYLKVLSQFHRYSFGNVMLITLQRPDASQVAGFHAWKKLGRSVKKGERGIKILAPVMRKKDEENEVEKSRDGEEEKRVVGFRTVHVFDVAQTEGDDLPGFAAVTGEPGYFIERIRSQIRDAGIELDTDYIESGALGVSTGGRITIRPGLNPAEEFSVLIHEFAHELLHRGERRQDTTKTIRETEAEAVAFAVCHRIGLKTGSAASDYIQLYNGSRETLQESLQHIRDCAAKILDGLLSNSSDEANESSSTQRAPMTQPNLF